MKLLLKIVLGILVFFGATLIALFVYGLFLGAKEAAQKPATPAVVAPTPTPFDAKKPTVPEEPQGNVFNDLGFRLTYPKDWVSETPNANTVVFSGPKETPAYYTTVNVQIIASAKAKGKYASVDALIESLRSQILTAGQPTLTDTVDQSFDNKAGTRVVAKGFAAVYTRQNETYQQLQFVSESADGEIFYAYSYTAPKDLYNQYKATAIMMIESLELLK